MTALRERVCRFLGSPLYSRTEVSRLIEILNGTGKVAIFGGMLRDLSLRGNRFFDSDVDLVVDSDGRSLTTLMNDMGASRNSFGGFRLAFKKWKVDVWAVETTWAFKEGFVAGSRFEDLVRTTFFDWDAIVFDTASSKIHAFPGYLSLLRKGVVGMNLESNPNPFGTTIRILRILSGEKADLSPNLAQYLSKRLAEFDNEFILNGMSRSPLAERRAGVPPAIWLDLVRSQLAQHQRSSASFPFSMRGRQGMLFHSEQPTTTV